MLMALYNYQSGKLERLQVLRGFLIMQAFIFIFIFIMMAFQDQGHIDLERATDRDP